MKTKNYANTNDFVCEVKKQYFELNSNTDFNGVSIVADYSQMIEILNCLAKNTDFKLFNIRLEEPDIMGYCDSWILTIDQDKHIWCQVAKYGNEYIKNDDSDFVFVHSDVNSKFVVKNNNLNMVEFSIINKEVKCKCSEDCPWYEECEENRKEDSNMGNSSSDINIEAEVKRLVEYIDEKLNSIFH